MVADSWIEFLRLLRCGGLVAAVMLPTAIFFALFSRFFREPILPRLRPWPVPWSGMDVALFLILGVLLPSFVAETLVEVKFFELIYGANIASGLSVPTEATVAAVTGAGAAHQAHEHILVQQTLKGLWGGLLALPLQLGVIWGLRWTLYPRWPFRPWTSPNAIPARLALAGFAWALLTPVVFLVHFASVYLSSQLDAAADDHPLTKLGPGRLPLDRAMFVIQACLAAPLIEEVLCRGILLPWVVRRTHRIPLVMASAIGIAVLFGFGAENVVNKYGTFLFLGLIFAMVLMIASKPRLARENVRYRRWGGIIASASLFAALHTTVWPSPIPLFVLGVGLGWLALRTRGILVPVIVHGGFNAISVLLVLHVG